MITVMDICLRQADKHRPPIKWALLFTTVGAGFKISYHFWNQILVTQSLCIAFDRYASNILSQRTLPNNKALWNARKCSTHQNRNVLETICSTLHSHKFVDSYNFTSHGNKNHSTFPKANMAAILNQHL